MQPGEALATAAQIAVAIAGFTGVVVVFGSSPVHEWSAVDLFRLKLLIATSVFPLVWCLFALLLLVTRLSQPSVWAWCSGFTGALLLGGLGAAVREFAGLASDEPGRKGSAVFYVAAAIGLLAVLLQVYNIVVLREFWPFFATVITGMTLSIFQFVRMTLQRTGEWALARRPPS